jgi:hypothetical protein
MASERKKEDPPRDRKKLLCWLQVGRTQAAKQEVNIPVRLSA